MYLKEVFLGICGLSFGLLAAAGVFTVLVSVGLVPRFAGKTHTSRKVLLYEEMVAVGTILGGIVSVYEPKLTLGLLAGNLFLALYGLFAGMFVGCLALAIAEMLNSIPIFARRVGLRHGTGIMILAVALGKLCGSFLYFWLEIR